MAHFFNNQKSLFSNSN